VKTYPYGFLVLPRIMHQCPPTLLGSPTHSLAILLSTQHTEMEAGTQLQPRVKTDNTWGRRLYNGKNYLYFWSVLYAVSFLVNAAAYSTRKFSSFAGVQSGKW